MKSTVLDTCDKSPRSVLAADITVKLRGTNYDDVATYLDDDFTWTTPGSDYRITKEQLKRQMDAIDHPDVTVESVTVLTAISQGNYAAVSSVARTSNNMEFHSHDLIEFSEKDDKDTIRKITSYTVDIHKG